FFSSRRRHTRSKRDWSSDVCSSDLSHRHNLAVDNTIDLNTLGQLGKLRVGGGHVLTIATSQSYRAGRIFGCSNYRGDGTNAIPFHLKSPIVCLTTDTSNIADTG